MPPAPLQLVVQPLNTPGPLPLQLSVGVQHGAGGRALGEERHQDLNTLVGALLVVILAALDRFQQAVPAAVVVRDALQRFENPAVAILGQ